MIPQQGNKIKVFLEACECSGVCACDTKLQQWRGEVLHVEYKHLHEHYFLPIQVELDHPYDAHEHYVIRVSLIDIVENRLAKNLKEIEPQFPPVLEIVTEKQKDIFAFEVDTDGQMTLF